MLSANSTQIRQNFMELLSKIYANYMKFQVTSTLSNIHLLRILQEVKLRSSYAWSVFSPGSSPQEIFLKMEVPVRPEIHQTIDILTLHRVSPFNNPHTYTCTFNSLVQFYF